MKAQNLLLKEAFNDNKHFIFISNSCIPLKNFDYNQLNENYSYFNICPQSQCFPRCNGALKYIDTNIIQKSHQWCILNKKHAELMLSTTEYMKWFVNCPDEHCYITNIYHRLENEIIITKY